MDDLYSDLPEDITSHHITKLENEVENLQSRIRTLEGTIKSREDDNEHIRKQLDCVQQENSILRANMSSLYRTAKAEIDRKNQQLQETRKSTSYQRSEDKGHGVENSANLKKGVRNVDELSSSTNPALAPKVDETIRENYQDELSSTRKTLKRLIDKILDNNNDLRFRSDTTDGSCGKSNERNHLLSRTNNESVDDDAGLSEISSNAFSDEELKVRSKKLKKSKKEKKLAPRSERRSSSSKQLKQDL